MNFIKGEIMVRGNPDTGLKHRTAGESPAAKAVGMAWITHHDLRHLFATRCIESGVDILTVSCWMGHKDGGALAKRTYGHLRDAHSTEMARKVTFSTAKPANVVTLESGVAA